MFSLNDSMRYFLCPGRTDMRKGISSLCGVVKEKMGCQVMNGDVFIFIGSSRKLMKLLHAEDGNHYRIPSSCTYKVLPSRQQYVVHFTGHFVPGSSALPQAQANPRRLYEAVVPSRHTFRYLLQEMLPESATSPRWWMPACSTSQVWLEATTLRIRLRLRRSRRTGDEGDAAGHCPLPTLVAGSHYRTHRSITHK